MHDMYERQVITQLRFYFSRNTCNFKKFRNAFYNYLIRIHLFIVLFVLYN